MARKQSDYTPEQWDTIVAFRKARNLARRLEQAATAQEAIAANHAAQAAKDGADDDVKAQAATEAAKAQQARKAAQAARAKSDRANKVSLAATAPKRAASRSKGTVSNGEAQAASN